MAVIRGKRGLRAWLWGGRSAQRAIYAGVAAVIVGASAWFAIDSRAQTVGAPATAPAMTFLKGAAVDPASLTGAWAATTATDGLCRDYSANAQICPGGARPRAPEVRELARALRGGPGLTSRPAAEIGEHVDLVYEYLRNSITTEFLFGTHKGPLGTIIERAGTPFDQAQLMVEVLKESGLAASYRFGQITLSGTDVYDWTGFQDAKATCRYFAAGGIPALINGSTNCETLTGQVQTAVVSHVWVQVTIGSGTYLFDPSFKRHTHVAGLEVRTAMGLTTGQPESVATSGVVSSSGSVSGFNNSGLKTLLDGYSATLLARLNQADMRGAGMDEVIGGERIIPVSRPVGGHRQTSLAYAGASTGWTAVPDQFRAVLKVQRRVTATEQLVEYATFFMDEIYGRRLELDPAVPVGAGGYSYTPHPVRNPVLRLDGVEVRRDLTAYEVNNFDRFTLNLRVEINHPFAALGGSYGDVAFERRIVAANPAMIVYSAGRTTQALGAKWATEQATDRYHALYGYTNNSHGEGAVSGPYGDKLRMGVTARWLSQFSMASRLNANIADARHQILHNLGFVYSAPSVSDSSGGEGVLLGSGPEIIDIVSGVAVTSRTNDAAARRGVTHTIAAVAAALEGSVMEQLSGAPDTVSAARRFAWANTPETGETTTMTARRFRAIAPYGAIPGATSLTFDGTVGGPTVKASALPAMQYPDRVAWFKNQLRTSLARYANDGFEIATSEDAGLGPGNLHGFWAPLISRNRGGAFVAKRYDAAGDVESVAYVVTSYFDESKGGGAANTQDNVAALQGQLQDSFEDRSSALGVNLTTGTAGYSSPVLRSIGQGGFPYKIEERLEVRGGGLTAGEGGISDPYGTPEVVSSLMGEVRLSGSAEEGMGASRVQAAVPAIVAFAAMQDAWRSATTQDVKREVAGALIADWWTRLVVMNMATMTQGATSSVFVRPGADQAGDYISAAPGGDRLEVGGGLVPVREDLGGTSGEWADNINTPPLDLAEIRTLALTASHVTWVSKEGQRRKFQVFGDSWNRQFLLSEWSFPEGVTLTFDYLGGTPKVTSNLGWSMNLGPEPRTWWATTTEAQWLDGPNAIGCLGLHANPTARSNYNYPASVSRTFSDAGSVTRRLRFRAPIGRTIDRRPDDFCRLEAVSLPGSTQSSVEYVFNSVNQVKEARDAIALAAPASRGAHKFFLAEGYRGERETPMGDRFAVEVLRQGREGRHIDEEGRASLADLDGRGRVIRRTAAFGNITEFKFDDRDNVIEVKRSPRAGCGTDTLYWCQTSTVTATYHPTWNRLASITLPATTLDAQAASTWTFEYDNKGRMISRTSPAIFNARTGVTEPAVWRTEYDVFGRVTWSKEPTGIETTTQYGSNGQSAWCMSRGVASSQASGGLNQVSTFTCDSVGNVLTETDPLGNTQTSTWDAMRRRQTQTGPAATNIRSAWTYDADGRVLTEKKWDSTANTWRTTETTYSLTGKPLTVTDPAGDRSRTCYDALDRTAVSVDASGRARSTEYNRAGQPRFIRQWYTANLADPTCALTAARPDNITTHVEREIRYNGGGLQSAELDGNGNLTSMAYDGLGRLMMKTFADGRFIQTLRNERDQVYTTFKRGGDIHQSYYDAIGRVHRTWEHPAASANMPYPFGRHSGTSYDLSGRTMMTWTSTQSATNGVYQAALERDIRTYVYDGAGRVVEDRVKPNDAGMGASQLAIQYEYDAGNNRTAIIWPDAYRATYRYDAAGRADRVQFGPSGNPAQNQADLTLDSLGRPQSVTRSNGVTSTWAYEVDSDLSGMDHNWATSSGQAPASFDLEHDPVGRITMSTVNRADLEWTPTLAEARAYGAPNNMNQLASANGQALTWDHNGNLDSYGSTDYVWTWGNRLAEVHAPGTDTYYAYDSLDRRTWMKEDNVVTRTLWSGASEIGEYSDDGTVLRRFIPDGSAAIDGRLAVVEVTAGAPPSNTARWFHTNNQGSVIAMSDSAGAPVGFTNYTPHGEFGTAADGVTRLTGPPAGSSFGYTGRQWDRKARLYQYRARYYNPELGIFLSHDPIGTKEDPNLYGYVGRDPVNNTDPTGECVQHPCWLEWFQARQNGVQQSPWEFLGWLMFPKPYVPPESTTYFIAQMNTVIFVGGKIEAGRYVHHDGKGNTTTGTIIAAAGAVGADFNLGGGIRMLFGAPKDGLTIEWSVAGGPLGVSGDLGQGPNSVEISGGWAPSIMPPASATISLGGIVHIPDRTDEDKAETQEFIDDVKRQEAERTELCSISACY